MSSRTSCFTRGTPSGCARPSWCRTTSRAPQPSRALVDHRGADRILRAPRDAARRPLVARRLPRRTSATRRARAGRRRGAAAPSRRRPSSTWQPPDDGERRLRRLLRARPPGRARRSTPPCAWPAAAVTGSTRWCARSSPRPSAPAASCPSTASGWPAPSTRSRPASARAWRGWRARRTKRLRSPSRSAAIGLTLAVQGVAAAHRRRLRRRAATATSCAWSPSATARPRGSPACKSGDRIVTIDGAAPAARWPEAIAHESAGRRRHARRRARQRRARPARHARRRARHDLQADAAARATPAVTKLRDALLTSVARRRGAPSEVREPLRVLGFSGAGACP